MKTRLSLMFVLFLTSSLCYSSQVSEFKIPFGKKTNAKGIITIDADFMSSNAHVISESFYGADSHGFTILPKADLVTPLRLGFVKLGGSSHSTYNWKINAYFDEGDKNIFYVYSPLEMRLKFIQQAYQTLPIFQVNMLGWQPDYDLNGKLSLQKTADEKYAAEAITFLNGTKKLGIKNILMGNEPFESEEVHGKPIPSADEYITNYIKYAVALRQAEEKNSGDSNNIKLWGPEIATGWVDWQTTHPADCTIDYGATPKIKCSYGGGKFTEFIPYLLYRLSKFENDAIKNPKKYKMLDYITWHYYPLFRKDFKDPGSIILNDDGSQNVAGMLESVNVWDNPLYINKYDFASTRNSTPIILDKFKRWRSEYYPKARLAVTEFAVDSLKNINYHSIVRPLYLADLIGRLGNGGVDTFVNSFLQSGNDASDWALINGGKKTHLYNIYSMFSKRYLGKTLATTDTFGDKINAYSSRVNDRVNVFVVNKESLIQNVSLHLKKGNKEDELTQIALPPWSLTVLSIPDDRNRMIEVFQYGAYEMDIPLN